MLRIYRDTLITEMKAAIKYTVAELLPFLLARSLESDLATGEKAVDIDGLVILNCVNLPLFKCT